MIDIILFIVSILIVIRTQCYGFWTLGEKNILGGIFIILLSALTAVLSAYLLVFNST